MARIRAGQGGPSMMDVARRAGVSIATVSNVVNGKGNVSQRTTERVNKAVSELGFVRNDAARMLATGSTSSIGMVLADLDNSLFVDMAHGAQQGADERGYRLLLGNSACSIPRQEDYLRLFDEARVAGVLLAPMEDSTVGIEQIRSHGRPIVLINYQQVGSDCCTVLVDNEMVGYLAARHLIDLGRRRLVFLADKDFYQPVHDRREGVRRAVSEMSDVSLEEIDTQGLRFEHGLKVAEDFGTLGRADLPDGVVAVTDEIANGLATGLHAQDIAVVPNDIAIIGCEDNRSAQSGPVLLTTVGLSGTQLGQAATDLLIEELTTPVWEHTHRTVIVAPSLVLRGSTAIGAFMPA
ncbi:LacI family transcriptional regulator [Microbacterium endophyticum]|uniref:LacI family transcriptional regulator n=1 Tax=Microbacterium endophyticum TaxID=1526412 RepID=A0A7W4V1Z9_9MICO|nr:LacI family DNA-binding transcriptional regulator [Microbacterium endophyticum]MBB2975079.1 LacI family transcriptional regulator [Microbacterium endophyticum]NIK37381.1 LacI family transcriptional regulator [Microbacterium endophyticum]